MSLSFHVYLDQSTNVLPAFLRGGGEMGALVRTHDWRNSALGLPHQWPLSLRTTLGILLHSTVPMCLLWGPERFCFYNDAYWSLLGKPGLVPGQRVIDRDGLSGAYIEQVMTTGEPVEAASQPVPVYPNRQPEPVHGPFSYGPAYGDNGQVSGVLITCTTTGGAGQQVRLSERQLANLVRDTVLGILVLIGEDHRVTIANDACGRLIDRRREELMDQPLFSVLPEARAVFQPIIDGVLTSGEPIYVTGQPGFAAGNGEKKAGFLNLTCQPYREPDGTITGVIVLCQDVTEQKKVDDEAARFKYMADNAHDPFMLMRADGTFAYLNQLALDRWGYTAAEAAHVDIYDIAPLTDKARFSAIFADAQTRRMPPFEALHRRKDGSVYPVEISMTGLQLDGLPHLFAIARDISERKQTEQSLRESERRFQGAISAVQGVLWTNNAAGQMEGEQPAWAALTGQTYDDYQGYGWSKVIHPDDIQPTFDAWIEAVATQQPFIFEHRVRRGDGSWGIFSVRAIPLLNAENAVREWVGVHTDLTEQRRAEEALRTSEAKLRSVVDNAPVAFGLLVGPDYQIESLNQAFGHVMTIEPEAIGQPVVNLLLQSGVDPAPFLHLLDQVYTTGQPVHSTETPIDMVVDGLVQRGYYSFSYIPLLDASGVVYAIADIGVDVTEQVLARQQIEKTEASLRSAVDLAQLATWSLDLTTNQYHYSDRFVAWLGLPERIVPAELAYATLPSRYQASVTQAINAVLQPDSPGLYENEYPIINRSTGQRRIIHVLAQVFYDPAGQPVSLSGMAQDVTMQRDLQETLERQVQERTDQLAAANEELAALNEELTTSNEELMTSSQETITVNEKLAESNHNLKRSNDNLLQFAYIASHDLQEPLRKIQQFGDLLKSQYADQLGNGLNYLERMQSAASRMSTLIRDLLSFSRISTQQDATTVVNLNAVLDTVLTDLEVRIEETGAVIKRERLPMVRGDGSQLGQLLLNLISNALKFSRPGVQPIVQVRSQLLRSDELAASVRPARPAKSYYRIDVTDNGIGFDAKYVDRIFQVFQRLHSKSEFAGTGIGLAICEKVAANHGGTITAVSQPGQGATFQVYLPA